MKRFLLFCFLSLALYGNAQDMDIYKKTKNGNYKLPNINQKMTFEEFELLSQNVRMKDMMYAGIVPGYIHFKAQEKKTGYWLLGIRSASYLTMLIVYLDFDNKYADLNIWDAQTSDQKTYENVFLGALTAVWGTYLYDLIHGESILHKKQEKIRYKYAIIAGKHPVTFQSNTYPSLSLTVQF
jgi:hypothetical protein